MDWATMTRGARDAAYNNGAAVGPGVAAAAVATWTEASAALRAGHPRFRAAAYGAAPRQRWDLFPATEPGAPCLVFIFGGWWQRNDRDVFSCMAEGVAAHGWAAALPGYTLAPEARLATIAGEIRAALDWLAAEGEAHGIAGPIVLAGWSAGGHLAALAADHRRVAAALPVSGAFELGPLRDVPSVNDALALTDAEVETLSPLRLTPAGVPMTIAYGTRELPAMVAQSRDLHAARASQHRAGALVPVAGADHFTVLDALRAPDGAITRAALDLVRT